MKISILTLFPEMFQGPFDYSIVKRALEDKKVLINFLNIRNFGRGRHKIVDDKPYGGGTGMILRVDVLHKAIQQIKDLNLDSSEQKVILLDPRGKEYNQNKAHEFSKLKHLILICGHYEGVDERIKNFIDERISIGNFIVTGGEIPAMLITDSVVRLVKGVLSDEATQHESFFQENYLEHPQFTRPSSYKKLLVPKILLSGDHKKIEQWKIDNTYNVRAGTAEREDTTGSTA